MTLKNNIWGVNIVKNVAIDKPWNRPGAAAYARARRKTLLHPPVTVYRMPADVRKDEDVPVRMRDGVTLRLNLFRPANAEGPLPVLLSAHPYRKDSMPRFKRGKWSLSFQFRIMNQPAPLRISDQTSWEAPDPAWWAQQGYAVINLDTRGGGHSEGRGDLLSDQEADATAREIWRTINGVNLRDNIITTRDRARLVFEKGSDHRVRRVRLRKI